VALESDARFQMYGGSVETSVLILPPGSKAILGFPALYENDLVLTPLAQLPEEQRNELIAVPSYENHTLVGALVYVPRPEPGWKKILRKLW
jgi:hypothetical protein